jgi:hypothetical protein
LQLALTPAFATFALGGPIDLFGMRRNTMVGGGAHSWQGVAGLMIEHAALICVLPADSEGLSWELGEIRRQRVTAKTIFVVPPREMADVPALSPATRRHLEALGYKLPKGIDPGFLLMDGDGGCERHIPFDCIWDGRLDAELCEILHARLLPPPGATEPS